MCSPALESSNDVVLELLAVPSNIRLARLVGSGLGSQAAMTMEEVEDLRIALDEACSWMVSNEPRGQLAVHFSLVDGTLHVEVCAEAGSPAAELPAGTREILDAVTDRWALGAGGTTVELRFVARRDPEPAA
jgi:serine/threonine-protein kinase RsbW